MSVEPVMWAFAVVVLFAYAVQTAAGFGSTLLCVTLGAHLLPIRDVVTLVVPISLIQNGYIAARHVGGVRWPLLLRRVLPLMGAGMAVGMTVAADLGGDWLRTLFAVLVLGLAGRELWVRWRARTDPGRTARPIPPAASIAAMVGAGLVHGIYATGGPMLVYAIGRAGLDKHQFRSTITTVWLVLNTALAIGFLLEGRYDRATTMDLLVLAPAVPLGIVLGELVHDRMDQRRFELIVFALLLGAAVSLLVR